MPTEKETLFIPSPPHARDCGAALPSAGKCRPAAGGASHRSNNGARRGCQLLDIRELPLPAGAALDDVDGAVIVAVIPVGVVQPAVDEIVDVAAVRDALVAAAFAVAVRGLMSGRARTAAVRVLRGNFQAALVDVIPVHGVEASAVEIIDVVSVADGGVPAALAVDVSMLGMDAVLRHGQPSFIPESEAKGYN